MKRTQIKDALRNIGKKKIAFLSICVIVFLGVGCFLWATFVKTALNRSASEYYKNRKFADIEMYSSIGIAESDIESIRAEEYVLDAEGVLQIDANLSFGEERKSIQLISLSLRVNVPELFEGTFPEAGNECALDKTTMEKSGIKIGDTVKISVSGDALKFAEFTVVGKINHPSYMRNDRAFYAVVSEAAFDADVTHGLYSKAVVLLDIPNGMDIFSDKYFEFTAEMEEKLSALAVRLGHERDADIHTSAEKEIAEARAELASRVAEAQKEIDDGEKIFREKIEDAERELAEAEQKILDGEKEISENEKKLADGEKELSEKEAETSKALKQARSEVSNGWYLFYKAERELKESKKKVAESEKKLTASLAQINEAIDVAENIRSALSFVRGHLYDFIDGNVSSDEIDAAWQNAEDAYEKYKAAVIEAYEPVVRAEVEEKDTTELVAVANEKTAAARSEFLSDIAVEQIIEWAELYITDNDILYEFNDVKDTLFGYIEDLAKAFAAKPILDEAMARLDDAKEQIKIGETELENNRRTLNDAESEIYNQENLAKKEFAKARTEIENGKAELESAKAEIETGKRELAEGREKYEEEKAKGEKEIADAKAELAKQRAEAEEKIALAEEELNKLGESGWIVQNRKVNESYVDISSVIKAMGTSSGAFASLFLIVGALVCFSTMAIIVSEQKKLIGATKAFGFFGREVFAKYAIFGVSATVLGIALGVAVAYLMERAMLKGLNGVYLFGVAESIVDVSTTAMVCIVAAALSIITTFVSCRDVLKKPASVLMNGGTDTQRKKKANAKQRGTVFSRLVWRNMRSELSRVIVSVAIILGCVGIIGVGFSMKFGYDGMLSRQFGDVIKYDLKISCDGISDDERDKLENVLDDYKVSSVCVSENGYATLVGDARESTIIIFAEDDEIQNFFAINDVNTGKPLSVSDDGVIIQSRLAEIYGLEAGDDIVIYDGTLKPHTVKVSGVFTNYQGRIAVMSNGARQKLLGEDTTGNRYYVNLNGCDEKELISALGSVSDGISFERGDAELKRLATFSGILNVSILGLTFIAILMAFIILTNLTNIFVKRRTNDLAVMSINGFSAKEMTRYLMRETVIINIIGILSGIVMGGAVAYVIIRMMEQPEMQLVRAFSVPSWAIATVLTALFSTVINAMAFRKVKKLNLMDAK